MSLAHQLRYLWYLLAGASALPAMHLGQSWWDDEYTRDGLGRTEGDTELPRHLLVAGLLRHYAPGGHVLDVGCGSGGLMMALREGDPAWLATYVGLDYSAQALEVAAARATGAGGLRDGESIYEFVQTNFDAYTVRTTFDAIVFSESLYYAPDPSRTLRRYADAMSDGGVLVVSMWRRPSRRRVWTAIHHGGFREQSRSRLIVRHRPAWDIVVFTRT